MLPEMLLALGQLMPTERIFSKPPWASDNIMMHSASLLTKLSMLG